MAAEILKLPQRAARPRRRTVHELTPPVGVRSESGRLLRLVVEVEKDAPGLATSYAVRVGPGEIARVRLERLGPDQAWIDWVYVPPGRRDLGLGSQLMRHVLRDADREGVRLGLEARACAEVSQEALEAWYGRLGFRHTGRRGDFGPVLERVPVRGQRAA